MAKDKKTDHYIDNKRFFTEISAWKVLVDAADAIDAKHPPITTYIGECFMAIAERLSRKPNFINYPYRDEMISDGIENCLLYAYNFDPKKSSNPFSYFTQIIYYAFLRRISKEKKQAYIKLKKIENSDLDSTTKRWFRENYLGGRDKPVVLTETDINNFEKKPDEPVVVAKTAKPKSKTKTKTNTIKKKSVKVKSISSDNPRKSNIRKSR